jgi:hypothetical protein
MTDDFLAEVRRRASVFYRSWTPNVALAFATADSSTLAPSRARFAGTEGGGSGTHLCDALRLARWARSSSA